MTNLTPEEMKAFADATKGVVDAWRDKIGADLIKAAQEDMAAARK